MDSRFIAVVGLLACLAVRPELARAQTTRVDFEDLRVGTSVDTQYLRMGLRVMSPTVIDTAPRAHGGRQLLRAGSPPTMMMAMVAAPPRLILGFERPQAFVRLFLTGRSRAHGHLWGTVRAYDKAGALRGRDGPRELDVQGATTRFAVGTKGAGIAFVNVEVVDSTPNGRSPAAAAIDDLEFGVPQAPSPQLVLVPDLRGLTPDAAAARLKGEALQLGPVRDSTTDRATPNTIVGQRPARRTRLKQGTPVSVMVARAPSRLPLILVIIAGVILGGAAAQQAWRRLRWRVGTRAHTGLESLRPRVTAPQEPRLEIRLVPVPSRGTQQLRKGP